MFYVRLPPGFTGKPALIYGAVISVIGLVFALVTIAMGASEVWVLGAGFVIVGITCMVRGVIGLARQKRAGGYGP